MTAAPKPWDGIPDSPQIDGWHWLVHGDPSPAIWSASEHVWSQGGLFCGGTGSPGSLTSDHYQGGVSYGGPIPSPDELAALLFEKQMLSRVLYELLNELGCPPDHQAALHAIAALRRVADAAWGLRCTEDGDGDKLWAALDALPDQEVQP